MAKHLDSEQPVSLVMAIPDHPWRKKRKRLPGETPDPDEKYAAVRVAMTVAKAGREGGVLRRVIGEAALDTDEPVIEFETDYGRINSDLTVGVDVTQCLTLKSNVGICSNGMKPLGRGFLITRAEAEALGLGRRPNLQNHIREYRNGRDLIGRPRNLFAIDLWGLSADEARSLFPEIYQHLLTTVKPGRDAAAARSKTKDAQEYAARWWTFCKPRQEMREFLTGLDRFIATVQTSKHRIFQFVHSNLMPDQKLMVFGHSDPYLLGVLSSRIHCVWTDRTCGWLGVGNDSVYVKVRSFDPFPFPNAPEELQAQIRLVAEELDAHRKVRQAEHPHLTLTQMYNVLEKLKLSEALTEDDERINGEGLVLILKELHQRLDALVFEAYGWPIMLSDEEILQRLVDLNAERSAEEASGKIGWLRPEYQIPKFGSEAEKARLEEERRKTREEARLRPKQGALELPDDLREMLPRGTATKPAFPTGSELAETAAVMGVLASTRSPMTIDSIAQSFSQGLQVRRRVALTVLALARLGHLSSPDDGDSFTLRRVA